MKKIIFLVLSILCSFNLSAQNSLAADSVKTTKHARNEFSAAKMENATKSQGDKAYIRNDFASAIQIYESLLNTKGEATEIYYNLGNSYYKKGDMARAILNYERALLLNPGDGDIRSNLEIARSKTVDKVEAAPQLFFISWTNSLINCMGADSWAKCGVVTFIFLIVALYFFIFSKKVILKKMGFIVSIVLLVVVILSNVFASHQKSLLANRNSAIIMTPTVTIKSTPNESGTDLFIIHEGRKVTIKDNSMKEWKEIILEDGNVGWIKTADLEII
ncbi:tetratricopeptide repeat protein [uncultured Bacteroides sp.]|uniref:tetratricopeptide repeat protein n=1 Tax=uncultured Bacteroides sp. TaxID=162156 RepID=UPI002AAA69BF|nr:tetratricopeptide repeat protein [uncultured Bacteroides sp.]